MSNLHQELYAQRSLCRSRTSHFCTLHLQRKLYTLQKTPWSKGFTSSLSVFKYEILDLDMYSQVVCAVSMRQEWQQKRRETTIKVRQRTNMARMRKPLERNQPSQVFLCTKAYLKWAKRNVVLNFIKNVYSCDKSDFHD